RSSRNTRPLVVPTKRRVAEAKIIEKAEPEPAGSVTTSGHDVPKLVEIKIWLPEPSATISASAGLPVLTGAPTKGDAMIPEVIGGVTSVQEPRLKGLML